MSSFPIFRTIHRILTPDRRMLIPAGNRVRVAVSLVHQNANTMLTIIFLAAALMLIPALVPAKHR